MNRKLRFIVIAIIALSAIFGPLFGAEEDVQRRIAAKERIQEESTFVGIFVLRDGSLFLEKVLKGKQCKIGEELIESRARGIVKSMNPGDKMVVIVGKDLNISRINHAFKITKESSVKGDWIITGKTGSRGEFLVEDQGDVFKFSLGVVFPSEN